MLIPQGTVLLQASLSFLVFQLNPFFSPYGMEAFVPNSGAPAGFFQWEVLMHPHAKDAPRLHVDRRGGAASPFTCCCLGTNSSPLVTLLRHPSLPSLKTGLLS